MLPRFTTYGGGSGTWTTTTTAESSGSGAKGRTSPARDDFEEDSDHFEEDSDSDSDFVWEFGSEDGGDDSDVEDPAAPPRQPRPSSRGDEKEHDVDLPTSNDLSSVSVVHLLLSGLLSHCSRKFASHHKFTTKVFNSTNFLLSFIGSVWQLTGKSVGLTTLTSDLVAAIELRDELIRLDQLDLALELCELWRKSAVVPPPMLAPVPAGLAETVFLPRTDVDGPGTAWDGLVVAGGAGADHDPVIVSSYPGTAGSGSYPVVEGGQGARTGAGSRTAGTSGLPAVTPATVVASAGGAGAGSHGVMAPTHFSLTSQDESRGSLAAGPSYRAAVEAGAPGGSTGGAGSSVAEAGLQKLPLDGLLDVPDLESFLDETPRAVTTNPDAEIDDAPPVLISSFPVSEARAISLFLLRKFDEGGTWISEHPSRSCLEEPGSSSSPEDPSPEEQISCLLAKLELAIRYPPLYNLEALQTALGLFTSNILHRALYISTSPLAPLPMYLFPKGPSAGGLSGGAAGGAAFWKGGVFGTVSKPPRGLEGIGEYLPSHHFYVEGDFVEEELLSGGVGSSNKRGASSASGPTIAGGSTALSSAEQTSGCDTTTSSIVALRKSICGEEVFFGNSLLVSSFVTQIGGPPPGAAESQFWNLPAPRVRDPLLDPRKYVLHVGRRLGDAYPPFHPFQEEVSPSAKSLHGGVGDHSREIATRRRSRFATTTPPEDKEVVLGGTTSLSSGGVVANPKSSSSDVQSGLLPMGPLDSTAAAGKLGGGVKIFPPGSPASEKFLPLFNAVCLLYPPIHSSKFTGWCAESETVHAGFSEAQFRREQRRTRRLQREMRRMRRLAAREAAWEAEFGGAGDYGAGLGTGVGADGGRSAGQLSSPDDVTPSSSGSKQANSTGVLVGTTGTTNTTTIAGAGTTLLGGGAAAPGFPSVSDDPRAAFGQSGSAFGQVRHSGPLLSSRDAQSVAHVLSHGGRTADGILNIDNDYASDVGVGSRRNSRETLIPLEDSAAILPTTKNFIRFPGGGKLPKGVKGSRVVSVKPVLNKVGGLREGGRDSSHSQSASAGGNAPAGSKSAGGNAPAASASSAVASKKSGAAAGDTSRPGSVLLPPTRLSGTTADGGGAAAPSSTGGPITSTRQPTSGVSTKSGLSLAAENTESSSTPRSSLGGSSTTLPGDQTTPSEPEQTAPAQLIVPTSATGVSSVPSSRGAIMSGLHSAAGLVMGYPRPITRPAAESNHSLITPPTPGTTTSGTSAVSVERGLRTGAYEIPFPADGEDSFSDSTNSSSDENWHFENDVDDEHGFDGEPWAVTVGGSSPSNPFSRFGSPSPTHVSDRSDMSGRWRAIRDGNPGQSHFMTFSIYQSQEDILKAVASIPGVSTTNPNQKDSKLIQKNEPKNDHKNDQKNDHKNDL